MSAEKDLQMASQIAELVRDTGGRTYFVGGCVRDSVLRRESKDIDLEIHGIAPEVLDEILRTLGEPLIMGSSFGIMGLRHYDLDIAMPQKHGRDGRDFYDAADPFAGTENAARRRDLTMNALMQDVLTGEIVDHFGGLADLAKGIIRHVDDVTFAQDPLRVIRAAQFAARFQFDVAQETVQLARKLDLSGISRERIWGELEKVLMKSEKPSVFFRVLREMDQLDTWFPEVKQLIGVEQNPKFHPEGDVWNHTMLVLDLAAQLRNRAEHPLKFMVAALCHDFGKITATTNTDGRIRSIGHELEGIGLAETFLRRLTNEAGVIRYVLNMVKLHMRPNQMAEQRSSSKSMCRLLDSSVAPKDLILLAKADHCSRPNASAYEKTEQYLYDHLKLYRERMAQPCVMGADLIQAGFRPGREFKDALDYAHKLRLAGVPKENALRQTIAFLNKEQEK